MEQRVKVIETGYHDRVNVLQGLIANDAQFAAPSPFDRIEWLELLRDSGLEPRIITAQDGPQYCTMTLMQNHSPLGTGALVAYRNWYSFTWRPLAHQSKSDERLLQAIASDLKHHSARITLEPLPDEDGTASTLVAAFKATGWRVQMSQCDINHILNVDNLTFDQYWAQRPGPLRTSLKRKAKKVDVQILEHFDPELWDQYEAIYAQSWKPEEDNPAMLRAYARQEGDAGRLRFGIAMHEGKPVAAQFWSVENGTAYIHKLAHLESARKLSAGTTLSAALMEHVIDKDKVALVDFGTGDQPYKADWMNAQRPRYRLDCINLSKPAGWLILARQKMSQFKDMLAGKLAPAQEQG